MTGSAASACRAVWTSRPSSWYSVEVPTTTSGRVVWASHGEGSLGGSHAHGPTITRFAGHSRRGYSKGSAVMYSSSGALANHCAMEATG